MVRISVRIRIKAHKRKGQRVKSHFRKICGSHPKTGFWYPERKEIKAQKPEGKYEPKTIEDLFFKVTKFKKRNENI